MTRPESVLSSRRRLVLSQRSPISLKKPLLLTCVIVAALILLVFPTTAAATEAWVTTHISTTSSANYAPQVSGDRVVWYGHDGSDFEIYTWTPSGGTVRITDNAYNDYTPVVYGDRVVWYGWDGSDFEIYTWVAGGGVAPLTNNSHDDVGCSISGDRVVWVYDDGSDTEIYTWKVGGSAVCLTLNSYDDYGPRVSGDRVTWRRDDGSGSEAKVYTWTPSGGEVLVADNCYDSEYYTPEVSGDRIVWYGSDGSDLEVYTWTPSGGTVRLTDNSYDDFAPQVSGDRVVWNANVRGGPDIPFDIFTWTSSGGTVRVTDDTDVHFRPEVSGDRLVWYGAGNVIGTQIFTWTPSGGMVMLTDNEYESYSPQVSGDRVVWYEDDGHDFDVYTATIVPATRYEQNHPGIDYRGPWALDCPSPYAASGWSYSYADEPGCSTNIAFTGVYLDWITRITPWSGIAKVVLDAGTPEEQVSMIDTWHWTDLHKQKVYSTGTLPNGPHTLSIYWTGEKREASWFDRIYTDAFDIVGTVTSASVAPPILWTYEEDDSRLTLLGDWTSGSTWLASGGSYVTTDQTGAGAVAKFTGTEVTVWAKKAPWYGKMEISVDGSYTETADLYEAWQGYKYPVYSKTGLSDTTHTLTIECLGEKSASSAGTAISLDALKITGYLDQAAGITKIDDKDGVYCTYDPEWSHWDNSGYWSAYQDTYAYTDKDGDKLTVAFNGRYLSWVAGTSDTKGKALATVDGNTAEAVEVDLYSPSTLWKQNVYSTGILSDGPHTVEIECLHEKNASSTWYTIDADRFDILLSTP